MKKITLLLIFLFLITYAKSQYLHRQGKIIVDGNNKEIILRGMGLGGWMLQEGYMLETSSFASPQHQIRAKIEVLVGNANTNTFYDAWLENHCTREDIDSMASWGFNSVRLPMHYNLFTLPIEKEQVEGQDTWLTKGFAMVDSLLDWCKNAKIYLILDLHGAPGGQGTDAAISDYDSSKPSLWESAENRRKTVALWRKLAEKYANEPYMGGYDLLNETNWAFTAGSNQNGCGETNNLPLRELLVNITKAIREVDKNHILLIEGNCWSGNFEDLTPPWDANMAYSFHKYWNATDVGTIKNHLAMRDAQNIPLWMGESGENSNQWCNETIKMLESSHIGWSWWPLKKISSMVCPLTVKKTSDYQKLLNYWEKGGAKPDTAFSTKALLEVADNLKIKKCTFHPDMIDAMFRQQTTDNTKPYKLQVIPGILTASDFDMGKAEIAYSDKYVMRDGTTDAVAGNEGWSYRNDGVDIDISTDNDKRSNGYCIGWIDNNEWTQYTVDVKQTAAYAISVRYSSGASGGTFHIEKDGVNISGTVNVKGTGGWQSWQNINIQNVILYQGIQALRIVFETGGYNLNFIDWKYSKPITDVPTQIANANTKVDGDTILVNFNKQLDKSAPLKLSDFTLMIGDNEFPVSSVTYSNESLNTIVLKITQIILYGDIVKVSYSGSTIKSDDGLVLETFANIVVKNNSPFRTTIPGKIEAEKYYVNSGFSAEVCTDTGSGQDMGYTDAKDYLDYLVYVPADGTFSFEYRIASTMGGSLELQVVDVPSKPVVLHSVTIPNTGGWQTWKSVSATAVLSRGPHTLRIFIKKAQFNINWFKVSKTTDMKGIDKLKKIHIYPNPAKDQINLNTEGIYGTYNVLIVNAQGIVVKQFHMEIKPNSVEQIDISALSDGYYILIIDNQTDKYYCDIIKLNY